MPVTPYYLGRPARVWIAAMSRRKPAPGGEKPRPKAGTEPPQPAPGPAEPEPDPIR
jgi:hypothetical protein